MVYRSKHVCAFRRGGGSTPYKGRLRPKKGSFFRSEVHKRVYLLPVEVWGRVGENEDSSERIPHVKSLEEGCDISTLGM